ncbi:Brix domain-containing protein [Gorgonomyces haynaldii]|nr:Brix domain-containing protein [Gorgonomyces haynaldii]
MLKQVKPKTAAGKRALEKKEPKPLEGAKPAVFLKGTTTSQIVSDLLKDLYALKKPDATMFSKRNDVHPFDDYKPLEFLSHKNDCAFFVLANHSKKRPHNLVFARMFDHQLMDMIELGVTNCDFMDEFKLTKANTGLGNRPLMLFNGPEWTQMEELKTARSIFLDLFTGDTSAELLDLRGVSHVISYSVEILAGKPIIKMRTFAVLLKKSGVKLPRVELENMGPHCDFEIRRHMPANPELLKEAMKIPKELITKKTKNVEENAFGEKTGRVWLENQDLSKLQTRKMKGLKRKAEQEAEEEEE